MTSHKDCIHWERGYCTNYCEDWGTPTNFTQQQTAQGFRFTTNAKFCSLLFSSLIKIKYEPLIKERCHHQRIVDGMPLNYCEYEPGVSANQEELRIKSVKKNISK